MTPAEAAALLTIAAFYDNRKPDEDTAKAWAMVLDEVRFVDGRDAIVAHFKRSKEWLMPVDVISGAKALRWKRIENFDKICRLEPPAHLADDPRAEIIWHRNVMQLVADGEVTHPSQVDERGDLKPRDMTQLGQIGRPVPNE